MSDEHKMIAGITLLDGHPVSRKHFQATRTLRAVNYVDSSSNYSKAVMPNDHVLG